ncbi:MAG: SAM-dependent methyltransferase, partial [Rhodospirillales bacterium]
MMVSHLLNRLVRVGSLGVIDANGKRHLFEGADGPAVTIRLGVRALHHRLLFNPPLTLGEAYMDGTVTVEDGDIYDLLALIGINMEIVGRSRFVGVRGWLGRAFRRFQQFNPTGWARANVAHHYDLSGALYELFLDADKQYSCAYFPDPGMGLDEAQEEKKRHIAAKLLIRPGHRVLDIGCGWGGLALYLARETGADVTGLTLSTEQLKEARRRARDAGLEDRVRFFLRDYREETGTYDRIVSV